MSVIDNSYDTEQDEGMLPKLMESANAFRVGKAAARSSKATARSQASTTDTTNGVAQRWLASNARAATRSTSSRSKYNTWPRMNGTGPLKVVLGKRNCSSMDSCDYDADTESKPRAGRPKPHSPRRICKVVDLTDDKEQCAVCSRTLRDRSSDTPQAFAYAICGCAICAICLEVILHDCKQSHHDIEATCLRPGHDINGMQSMHRVYVADCSICLSNANERNSWFFQAPAVSLSTIRTRCGHLFCSDCIEQWILSQGDQDTTRCPNCKAETSIHPFQTVQRGELKTAILSDAAVSRCTKRPLPT